MSNTIGDSLNKEQTEKLNAIKTENAGRPKFIKKERKVLENGLPYATKFYPEHFVKIALVIKHNAEFRRMISLAIRNYLVEHEVVSKDDKVYITYLWNKFAVKVNGLSREYLYTEKMFVDNFAAAIVLTSNYFQYVLSNFSNEEDIDVDLNYANDIIHHVHPRSSERDEDVVSE